MRCKICALKSRSSRVYMINVIGKTSYPAYWMENLIRKDFICIVRMLLPKAFTWPGKYC